MLLPYWNHLGEVHQLESYPESFEDWVCGEKLPAARRSLHDAVKAILGKAVVQTSCRGQDMNIVCLS